MKKGHIIIGLSMFLICQCVYSNVRPATIFGNNMVLQRNKKIPVWGWAGKNEQVTVEFNGMKKTTTADDNGKWMVNIGPFKAGGPYEMKIAGKNTVALKNILIGEVWLCSGQSNMQWGVKNMNNAEAEIAGADYPQIRLATFSGTGFEPKKNLAWKHWGRGWKECSPKTISNFSAVGYFFGRELYKTLKVPIGLVATPEGASPIRAWISADIQRSNPLFKEMLEDYKTYAERKKAYHIKRKAYKKALEKSKAEGTKPPKFPGFFEAYGDAPGLLYNARIIPLAPFAIRGVIWYQGENDAIYKHSSTYKDFFPIMIKDWRDLWRRSSLSGNADKSDGDFPFLYVQLAALGGRIKRPIESHWAEVRDAQRKTLKVKNTAMVVITDICEVSLHPRNKTEVGKRLANAACAIAYNKKCVYSGPIYDNVKFKDGKAIVSFTHIGSGLTLKGDKLEDFTIAGADKKFYIAKAEIKGDKVIVSSDKVKDPKAVRYAWKTNPYGNLFNKEGYPASCFRTDNWQTLK